jgi:hypothetical protein
MPDPTRLTPHTIKVDIRLDPASLPAGLGAEGKAAPEVEVALGPGLIARARLNAKSARKVLKTVAESGPDACVVSLSGTLKPPANMGPPWTLEACGIQAFVKQPKPAPEGQAS